MTRPDPRLVDVVEHELEHLADMPVAELNRHTIAERIATAAWAWLAEGDENPRSGHG